jgi:hypothetical protein
MHARAALLARILAGRGGVEPAGTDPPSVGGPEPAAADG